MLSLPCDYEVMQLVTQRGYGGGTMEALRGKDLLSDVLSLMSVDTILTDDILDVEGDPGLMGKAARKDRSAGKATFVSALGLETAKSEAERLAQRAKMHLRPFGQNAALLSETVDFVLRRRS